jgi:hypothetical protein
MKGLTRWLRVGVTVAAVVAAGIGTWMLLHSDEEPMRGLERDLPTAVDGWRAMDAGVLYDPESIFSYIDGHAEIYLAYGMRGCLARRYAGPEGEGAVVLDVFWLASSEDAFGIFTFDREGEEVDIGQGALLRNGWLSLWKDRFFVSVYAEEDSPRARDAMLALGRQVADSIPAEGRLPAVLTALPAAGRDDRSVRFLRSHEILNIHLAASHDNVLHLSSNTAAAMARYERDGARAWLIVVDYTLPEEAEKARRSFGQTVAGDQPDRGTEGESGSSLFAGARVDRRRLAVVIEATTRELVDSLLGEIPDGGLS